MEKRYQTLPCNAFAIEGEPNLPARGKNIRHPKHGPTSWVFYYCCEGKKRQVRKMTAAVGFPTLRLVRVRIGDIHLDSLMPGEVASILSIDDAIN